MSGHMYGAIPRTTETELETEPETKPETDTDTETENGNGNGTFNIRDFGLSTRIRSFVRVIFSVCLSVYLLDIWRFLYLPTLLLKYHHYTCHLKSKTAGENVNLWKPTLLFHKTVHPDLFFLVVYRILKEIQLDHIRGCYCHQNQRHLCFSIIKVDNFWTIPLKNTLRVLFYSSSSEPLLIKIMMMKSLNSPRTL